MWKWLAEHLPKIKEEGFRLPCPVPARDGRWVVDGWCAQKAVSGEHPQEGRWGEVIAAGERFHQASAHLPRPAFLDHRTDPWALGDRVAWGKTEPPASPEPLRRLLELRRPISLQSQLIHGDLSENVLFVEGEPPAIIDVSPYWRPEGFASAIVVADAVCWRNADPADLLSHVSHVDEFPQHLVRALIYRMVTTIAVAADEPDLRGYRPGMELAERLAS